MVRTLLVRGMLVGLLAGLLVFAFGRVFGEPQVDHAIAFETALGAARAKAEAARGIVVPEEPELVSRPVQAGLGLLTGVVVYGVAFGGLFALAFAYANGRMGVLRPRAVAGLLALLGFLAVHVVPDLKYPANPPSVGNPDTIGERTGLYFLMVALSLGGMVAAGALRRRLVRRLGPWSASVAATAAYVAAMAVVMLLLPAINEVPEAFPAVVLWRFRVASFGMQLVMWTTLGLGFGALAERALPARRGWGGMHAALR